MSPHEDDNRVRTEHKCSIPKVLACSPWKCVVTYSG